MLPLLRRTFATFPRGSGGSWGNGRGRGGRRWREKRRCGRWMQRQGRAAAVLPLLRAIFGGDGDGRDRGVREAQGVRPPTEAMERREEQLRRWRLESGRWGERRDRTEADTAGPGHGPHAGGAVDPDRKAGLGASAPGVARWLGDIREYFPTQVVRVMQGDALTRLGLKQMLLEPRSCWRRWSRMSTWWARC